MGVIIIVCAIIIAWTVYSKLYDENIPWDESNRYRINPTTTGGNAINELNIIKIKLLPLKFAMDKNAAIGNDKNSDSIIAKNDTIIDVNIIFTYSWLRLNIKFIESFKICEKSVMKFYLIYLDIYPVYLFY